MTYSYDFFLNETFDPTRAYSNFDGYRPGVILDKAYSGEVDAATPEAACEALFAKFNCEHPADYKNRSMSVGDVLMLTDGVRVLYFACESVGFKKIGDPALQPRMAGVCHKDVYFKHQALYEDMRRNGTAAFFLSAVRLAEAKTKPGKTLTLNEYEAEMLFALVVAASGNGTDPVDAQVRISIRRQLGMMVLNNDVETVGQ